MSDHVPVNVETHPDWNREPGLAVVPGSKLAQEYARFEMFPHSKWCVGGLQPGNPYRKGNEYGKAGAEFPKMIYKAQRSELTGGQIACMAAPPDPLSFQDPREYERAERSAVKFTEQCQKIVHNVRELEIAIADGWAEHPDEAVRRQEEREKAVFTATAHRTYEDRNLTGPALQEAQEAIAAAGGEHVPEIVEKPRSRRQK